MASPAGKTRIKTAAIAVPVPCDRDEASRYIAEIGIEQRTRARIEACMNDELAEIKARWEKKAEPHGERIAALAAGVQVWCEAHRAELLKNDSKTAGFPAGEVLWRVRPPRCVVRGAEAVIEALKRLGLARFVRSKEEVNKEAILNEPEAVRGVAGIAIEQGEDFVIKPFESELEEVA